MNDIMNEISFLELNILLIDYTCFVFQFSCTQHSLDYCLLLTFL